jgi:cell division transport system permease protein
VTRSGKRDESGWGPWAAWRAQHRAAASNSWQKLVAQPAVTAVTWLVIAISLALPSTLLLTLDNLSAVAGGVDRPSQLSVLLTGDSELPVAEQLQRTLKNWSEIDDVVLLDRELALSQFIQQADLAGVMGSLARNPLPHTLIVMPVHGLSAAVMTDLRQRLQTLPGVDRVIADTRWIARLETALQAGWRWVLGLGTVMLMGGVLVLGNTLRLAIEARKDEILVVHLIGGSPAFARRPFLYLGLWYGVGGGVVAALLLMMMAWWMTGPVNTLFLLYESPQKMRLPGAFYPISLTALGGFLGLLSAWLAAGRYFRQLVARTSTQNR